ncbi:MAG: hypothetical protein ACOZJX_04740 [Pseudomonadota bacterium]
MPLRTAPFLRSRRAGLLAATWLVLAPLANALAADRFVAHEICDCQVTGLSADGRVAVGRMRTGAPFLWTPQRGVEILGRNPYGHDVSLDEDMPAISGDGRRVAATIRDRRTGDAVQGVWTRATGWRQARALPPDAGAADGVASVVSGLSRDGKVVVGSYVRATGEGGRSHASTWTAAGGLQGLGSGGGLSWLHAASADGAVQVGVDTDPVLGYHRAAVWAGGQRQWVDESTISWGRAINAAGDTVVGAAVDQTGEYAAALWRRQGGQWLLQSLGRLPDATGFAVANGVSDDGGTVVGEGAWVDRIFDLRQTGFVWTAETGLLPAIDFFGGRLAGMGTEHRIDTITTISGDGQVMGVVARRSDWQEPLYRSYLVHRVPAGEAR